MWRRKPLPSNQRSTAAPAAPVTSSRRSVRTRRLHLRAGRLERGEVVAADELRRGDADPREVERALEAQRAAPPQRRAIGRVPERVAVELAAWRRGARRSRRAPRATLAHRDVVGQRRVQRAAQPLGLERGLEPHARDLPLRVHARVGAARARPRARARASRARARSRARPARCGVRPAGSASPRTPPRRTRA